MKLWIALLLFNFTAYSSELFQDEKEANEAATDIPYHFKLLDRLVNSIKANLPVLFNSVLKEAKDSQINLINDFDISEQKTPLMHACQNGRLEMVETLIKNGADINMCNNKKKGDDAGWCALMYAAHDGHENVVNYLLSFITLDVNNISEEFFYANIITKMRFKNVQSITFIKRYKAIKEPYANKIQEVTDLLPPLSRMVADYYI